MSILLVSAAGSIAYLSNALSPASPSTQTATGNDALLSVTGYEDRDGDGLTDRDETYWRTNPDITDTDGDGYSDGEEVLSGHNPTIKGPNDFLDTARNVTEQAFSLAIGGLTSGDLDPQNPNYQQSLKELSDAMAEQFKKNTTITTDTLDIIEDTSANKLTYLNTMANMILTVIVPTMEANSAFLETLRDLPLSNPSVIAGDPTRYAQYLKDVRRLSSTIGDRAARISAIPVPKSFSPQHTVILRLLRLEQRYYEILATMKEDPVQGSAALGALMRIHFEGTQEVLYDFAVAIQNKL
mgnify:FL=1